MPRMKQFTNEHETPPRDYVVYHCLGCGYNHSVPVTAGKGVAWGFNNDLEKPTIQPSVRHFYTYSAEHRKAGQQQTTCHYFIRDGKIQYLDDCTHALKNQTIDLPEFPVETETAE